MLSIFIKFIVTINQKTPYVSFPSYNSPNDPVMFPYEIQIYVHLDQ